MEYILIGAGGHSKVIHDALLSDGESIKGFFDDTTVTQTDNTFQYYGKIEQILDCSTEFIAEHKFVIAIGNNSVRKQIVSLLESKKITYGTVIHPSAVIASDVKIGEGSVILANVVVNAATTIGKHVILNSSSSIDHDNVIDNFVHISPGVHTAGAVEIGKGTHVGIGTNILPMKKIGSWCIIGGGTMVNKDIGSNLLAYGVPVKVKKEGINVEK